MTSKCISRFCSSLIGTAACLFATTSQGPAFAQLAQGNYVYTDQSALLLIPPTRVSDDTFSFTWSPDSVRLLTFNIHRVDRYFNFDVDDHAPPESDLEIGRWNKVSRFADVLWKQRYDTEPTLSGDPMWIPHSEYVAQEVFWQAKETVPNGVGGTMTQLRPQQEVLWINAARSTVHSIPLAMGARLEVSPIKSLAVMVDQSFEAAKIQAVLTPIRMDGSVGIPAPLPLNQLLAASSWTADGARLILTMNLAGSQNQGKTFTYAYDPVTGELKTIQAPIPGQLWHAVPQIKHDIVLKPTVEHLRAPGLDIESHPLWAESIVKSEKPGMLICTDADLGLVSPNGTSIAYRSQRSTWVTVIKPIALAVFKTMVAKAQRQTAISNGKQLGLAAIMWATDHGDTLPGPNDINAELKPYLQTDKLFDQFNYTYSGGPLSAIASPSETVLGTVDGPGGQALIYADGHVKWQNR